MPSPEVRVGAWAPGPRCPPHGSRLSLCRAWQGKRGKELLSQVQGLAATLLVWREARAAPCHLAGSPAPLLRKYLKQRSPPAITGRLCLCLELLS